MDSFFSGDTYSKVYGWPADQSPMPFSQPGLITIPLGFLVLIVVSLLTTSGAKASLTDELTDIVMAIDIDLSPGYRTSKAVFPLHRPLSAQLAEWPIANVDAARRSNHIPWHAGHAVRGGDALTINPSPPKQTPPDGRQCSQGSQRDAATRMADRDEVGMLLETQLDRVLTLLEEQASSIIERASETPPNSDWPLLIEILFTAGTMKRDTRARCICWQNSIGNQNRWLSVLKAFKIRLSLRRSLK